MKRNKILSLTLAVCSVMLAPDFSYAKRSGYSSSSSALTAAALVYMATRNRGNNRYRGGDDYNPNNFKISENIEQLSGNRYVYIGHQRVYEFPESITNFVRLSSQFIPIDGKVKRHILSDSQLPRIENVNEIISTAKEQNSFCVAQKEESILQREPLSKRKRELNVEIYDIKNSYGYSWLGFYKDDLATLEEERSELLSEIETLKTEEDAKENECLSNIDFFDGDLVEFNRDIAKKYSWTSLGANESLEIQGHSEEVSFSLECNENEELIRYRNPYSEFKGFNKFSGVHPIRKNKSHERWNNLTVWACRDMSLNTLNSFVMKRDDQREFLFLNTVVNNENLERVQLLDIKKQIMLEERLFRSAESSSDVLIYANTRDLQYEASYKVYVR
jgi:hypothetical protein